ncbi:hypothetical protein B0T18DRAFT_206943 [Schizothecium vesticola]|uniref:Uncharacterized protein n=1 Tax=Schizothecium vesticola TaxID=314040 RepID=A0AA40JYQ6_9PEZI|nr:hypothetical protein B0T18DRAFT_206943 [Schizothecium vesticola]
MDPSPPSPPSSDEPPPNPTSAPITPTNIATHPPEFTLRPPRPQLGPPNSHLGNLSTPGDLVDFAHEPDQHAPAAEPNGSPTSPPETPFQGDLLDQLRQLTTGNPLINPGVPPTGGNQLTTPARQAVDEMRVGTQAMENFITRMEKIEHQFDRINDRFSRVNNMLADLKMSNIELGEEIKKSVSSKGGNPTNDGRPAARDLLDLIKTLVSGMGLHGRVDGLMARTAAVEKAVNASAETQAKRLDNYTRHLVDVEKLCRDGLGRVDNYAKDLVDVAKLCRDGFSRVDTEMDTFEAWVGKAFKLTHDRFDGVARFLHRVMQAKQLQDKRDINKQKSVNDTCSRRINSLNRRLEEMEQVRVPEKVPEKGVGSNTVVRQDFRGYRPPRLPDRTGRIRSLSM